VDQTQREWTADELRAAVYAEFLYGYGAAPGLDLGRPIAYTRSGSIYRQEFEHGITLANVGEENVDVYVGAGYLDLDHVLSRYVLLPPHSAQVLIKLAG
jgi:hypothetical protein